MGLVQDICDGRSVFSISRMRRAAMGIPRFGIFALNLFLASCSGGGGDESVPPPTNSGPSISITSPTTDPTFSEVCNTEALTGDAGLGTSHSCCNGTAEQLTGVRVTWKNATTGTSGQASQSVQICSIFGMPPSICSHNWGAPVPLVLGDNRIIVTATDTITGWTDTDTITINTPALSYTVSGTLHTVDQIGVGYFESGVGLQLSPDAARSTISGSRAQAGKFVISCLTNGPYTITPTTNNTFNYLFQPPAHSFTVSGADVSALDFQTTAFAVTGMIRDTLGNPLGSVGFSVTISGGGISWSQIQDGTGTHNFVVPNGTYTLIPAPSCTSCIFTPPTRTIVVNNAGVSGQDFVLQ
jgi:hypothetical protein